MDLSSAKDVQQVLEALGTGGPEAEAFLRRFVVENADQIDDLAALFEQIVHFSGDVSKIENLTHEPVGIDEFLESKEFLGMTNEGLWPEVRACITTAITGGYPEIILTGAIGIGKTTVAQVISAYTLYVLSCYRIPQLVYGLLPSTEIYLVMMNRTDTLAKMVTFGGFKAMLERVPYFKDHFAPSRYINTRLDFPRGVKVIPSAAYGENVLGMSVFGGIIDEMNFMTRVEQSKRVFDGGQFDQAQKVYTALVRRQKTRFLQKGKLPGSLCLVSSKNYPGDFTDMRLRELERETDGTTFVFDKAQWDVVPATRFSGVTFRLDLGDERHSPKVLDEGVEVRAEARIIQVPIEFKREFEKDMEGSLRDYAGRTTEAAKPYIWDKAAIWRCAERWAQAGLRAPFGPLAERIRTKDDALDISELLPSLDPFYEVPDPLLWRVAHIDLGLTSDHAGLAIGYVRGIEQVSRRDMATGETFVEELPIVVVDQMLTIKPPRGGEIEFAQVRQILYLLRDVAKLPIRIVSYDGFQSVDSRQILRRHGFFADHMSVEGLEAYRGLRDAIFQGRILMQPHPHCFHELSTVEKTLDGKKVDHPPLGSKDQADGLAGMYATLMRYRRSWRQPLVIQDEGGRKEKVISIRRNVARRVVERRVSTRT